MSRKKPLKVNSEVYKERITQLFTKVNDYWESPELKMVNFRVSEVTFPQSHRLMELLGTESIRLGGYYDGPGCPTCDYGAETAIGVTCQEVKFENKFGEALEAE